MRSTKSLKFILIFILSICALFLFSPNTRATDGVAVSGSFTNYEYTIVQGQTLESPLINIIFYNNYSKDINIQLHLDAPEGIQIPLDEQLITLEENSRLDLPIKITVDNSVPIGEYIITMTAALIDSSIDGVINTGAEYALHSQINVVNQSSQINLELVNSDGSNINADTYLYLITDGSKSPAGYSNNGKLTSTLAPGQYEIVSYHNNIKIASEQILLENNAYLSQTIYAQTVFINNYNIFPNYNELEKNLRSLNLNYTLQNIYEELIDVSVTLNIYKDNILIEQRDITLFDVLPLGNQEISYQYDAENPFTEGSYEFVLQVYSNQETDDKTIYTESLPKILSVANDKKNITDVIDIRIILLAVLIVIGIGLYFLFRWIAKINPEIDDENLSSDPEIFEQKAIDAPADSAELDKKEESAQDGNTSDTILPDEIKTCSSCDNHEQMVCPVCNGEGKTKYGAIQEECIYCSGLGVVVCASCINREQLRVCPRCSGAGFTEKDKQKSECTFCNSLGHVHKHQNAMYIDTTKVKLGVKKGKNGDK